MWLDDNIKTACPYITTIVIMLVIILCFRTTGTYYARGSESLSARITSAMQIVAERETPTRQ